MAFYDLPLAELETYRPDVQEPGDFDDFWARTLAEARSFPLNVRVDPAESPLSAVEVYDVTFAGWGGHPIKAWLMLPAGASGPLPAVVEFNGYGGGRGFPHERLPWPASGYAYLFMDTRGQGSGWGTGGDTPDPHGTGPSSPGFMTRGIQSPEDYYYRRVFTDAVRAVEAVRSLDIVDASRVAVAGGSQGGGITIAVAGLVPDVIAAMPEVPFLSHFRRAVAVTNGFPYGEITQYLAVHRYEVEQVFATLSYFDGVNFAKRATAPTLFSVALMDDICPPSTVFASYNHWAGTKAIEVYPYNNHEGGAAYHFVRQAAFLSDLV